ncbi:VWA domain-containing protein [Sulfidibacter corallicola]|uniref:VWA domain-containing protein n=1 Tax=Sulfidibacter corallicola TaxID=2818388 RepID=A0A8A4TUE4_SULCO|nr:VIT domain-containing protein [Sulfidibacter corallicola]QTD52977.1 VWA domain-containing protein [Sulfidibacter corallicola]
MNGSMAQSKCWVSCFRVLVLLPFVCFILSSGAALATGATGYDDTGSAGVLNGVDSNGRRLVLPLKETSVHLEITGDVVQARVTQTFYNDTDVFLEAVYAFPLPAKATVTNMQLRLDDRIVRSVVREKQQARKTYEEARSQGRRTALLEQDRTNLFTTSVANFGPGDEVSITFNYIEPLELQTGTYEVTFPTVFGPRYFDRSGEVAAVPIVEVEAPSLESAGSLTNQEPVFEALVSPAAPPIVDEARNEHFIQLTAAIRGIPAMEVISTTHDIFVSHVGEQAFDVELSLGDDLPNRDFTLKIPLDELDVPEISFIQSQRPDGIHGMLTVYPPTADGVDVQAVPREVVFLVDTSGSMQGLSMDQAKAGLKACMGMLNPEDRFNIVRFSGDYSPFRADFSEASLENLRDAYNYVDYLTADGGTHMQQALGYVLDMPKQEGFMRVVVLLTDGDVGNENTLFRLVNEKLDQARIFSFGIGTAPNEFLLRKLSQTGYGVANFLRNGEDIGEVMHDFFETVNAPVLTDVEVTFTKRDGSPVEAAEMYPEVVPDLFMGRPIRLLYRSGRPLDGQLEVSGWYNGEWVSFSYEIDRSVTTQYAGIEKVFGKAKVDALMGEYLHADTFDKEAFRGRIVDAALRYQLVTAFTSRVAVEERITKAAHEDVEKVAVPALAKAGSGAGFAPTATQDFAWLGLGLLLIGLALAVHLEISSRHRDQRPRV